MLLLFWVALLTECVDRNCDEYYCYNSCIVALLTECVDRNMRPTLDPQRVFEVALLTECVDRNLKDLSQSTTRLGRTL